VGIDTIFGSVITFTTACGAITSLPWSDYFDTYGSGSSTYFPTCWLRNSAGTTTAPYISTTNASAPGSLYFSASSTTINRIMAVSPMFDPSIPMNTLKADFKVRASGTDDTLIVGVMTDPADVTTFETVASIFLSTTSTFIDKEVYFNNYTGSGQYIAFRVNYGPNSSTMYIDNLDVTTIPVCPRPYNTTSSNITTTSAELSWTEIGTATQWEVEYGPLGFVQGTGTVISVSSNPYILSGLNHSMRYTYYVKAICSPSDQSTWSLGANFTTACGNIASLPWMENFDSHGTGSSVLPLCWSRNSTSSTAPYINTTNFSTPGALYFYPSSSGNRFMAITPMFDSSIPINSLKAEFKLRATGNDDTLRIGVITDPLDLTTFEVIDKKVLSTTGTFQDVEVFFNNYTGSGQYIAFSVSYGASSAQMYMDNLLIMTIPTCPRPNTLTSSNYTTSSAELAWVESGTASSWEVEYGPVGFTQGMGTVVSAPSNPFVLNGLSSSTQYSYYVKSICGPGDESIWSTTFNTFATLCEPLTNLPIVETCENTATNELPLCFSKIISGNAIVGVETYNSNKVIKMNSGSTTNNCFLVFPALIEPANNIRIMFKYIGGDNHNFKIGYLTNGEDASTFEIIHTVSLSGTGTWKSFDIISTNTMTGSERIAIKFEMPTTSYYVYLDSITIQVQPPCSEVTSLAISSLNSTDATVTWVGNGTSFNLEYKEISSSTWIPVNNVTTPYTINSLTQNTQYQFRIQNVCEGGILGAWSTPYSFSTPCDPVSTLPYVEDFETTPIDDIPSCFEEIQNGNANIKVINSSWGGKVLEMSYGSSASGDCYIILPQFTTPLNMLRISFKYDGGTDNHKFGYITDPTNPATFTEIFNVNIQSNTGGWYFYDMLTNNTLTGSERIAIKYNPSAGYHNNRYDSLTVDIMPSCLPPFGLNATSITTTDAILSWSPAGTNTPVDYNLDYRPVGSTTWTTVNNVTPPYSLGGLMASTFYEYRLQANCGGSVFTDWSTVATFMTACGSITTLPWADSFDAYGTGTTSFPPCWNKTQLGSNSFYISSTNASSPGSLYSYVGTSGNYNIAVTPQFDATIPVNTLKVDFKYRVSSNDDTLYVGVMTNPTDASTFELIAKKIPATTGAFQDMEVYMNNYTGVGQYIAFKTAYTASSSTTYLDNVVVSTIPACPTPSALTSSNISAYSADFTWLENGTATSWVIEYGPVGFTQGTGTVVPNVTTNPYTLTGLTPNSTYQFYVQSNCSGNYSAYSNAVTLTTGLIPINLPYTNDFENPLTYTDFGFLNGTQANKWTIGSATGVNNTVGGTNAMYISNDNGTTWAYTAGTVGNSKVYAYMDINVPTGANEILLDFDWIAQGSSAQYDFLRVYMMPITIPVTAGNIPPTVNSVNYDLTAMIGHYTGGPGDHWLSVQSTWQHKQFNINSTQFPNLAGNTWRLYFHWRNDQTNAVQPPATIDNISIVISTCPAPSALAVTNVSSSSVELGWTENGSATTWTVEYGPAGFTLGTGTQVIASANPFVVPGLNPATIYDFYVKANCGASDFSGWTNKVTATKSCVPVALPIIEGFESSLSIPTCWTTTYTLNNFNVTTTGTSPTCSPNGGSNMLRFNSFNTTAGNHAVLYSPLINVTGDSISVSYWQYRDPGYNGAQYATEGIEVFYNTTPSLTGATSLGFTSRSFATAGWYQISYIIPSGLIGNAFVIFKATSEYGNNQFIDDISIAYTTIVPCTVPTNLAVSAITTSTATATWTAGGSETQWEVAYKPTSASTWNSAFVTAPTYNFSTLTAATVYDVKVRAICEVGDTSAYTAVVNFTTATPPCNVPTNLQVPTATITDQSAIFTWTAGGTETQWQVEYKLVSSTNWTTMPVSTTTTQLIQALQSNSTYEVRVKALCGTGDESPFTTPIQFTTTGTTTYVITATSNSFGTITPSGSVIVTAGADQLFTFTPNTNCEIDSLVIDNAAPIDYSLATYTFTAVASNRSIYVIFKHLDGIENNNLSNFVSLYPNPTNSTIELKINQTQLQVRECQLYDIYGKLIKVITITEENTKIDVSEYASGVYFVRMNTEMGPISKKFVKK
jgi:hypothetical protein